MNCISLKKLLVEAKLYGYSTKELLDQFLEFEGKTLIFFDTETTGLEPNVVYVQLTQISALAVDGSTMEPIGDFDEKVKIIPAVDRLMNDPNSWEAKKFAQSNERHRIKYKKDITHPEELLKMTQYYSGEPARYDEKQALLDFEKFVGKFNNVVLIAHNATFDMKTIQTRRGKYGLPRMKTYPVLDTLKISRYFFVPTLLSLEGNEEAEEYLKFLLNKTKYKNYNVTLGKLASLFQVKLDDWHNSAADVKMLFDILRKMIEYLKRNLSVNIDKEKSKAAKRFRRF
jgi:DNA polymerase III alpha subunit (gram-positive type)